MMLSLVLRLLLCGCMLLGWCPATDLLRTISLLATSNPSNPEDSSEEQVQESVDHVLVVRRFSVRRAELSGAAERLACTAPALRLAGEPSIALRRGHSLPNGMCAPLRI